MLRHHGDGFRTDSGGTTSRGGAPVTARARLTIEERVADGLHVALVNHAGGYPVGVRSRGALLLAIDACTEELGHGATRRLLLQAARTLR